MTPPEKMLHSSHENAVECARRSLEALRNGDGFSSACWERRAEFYRNEARWIAEQMARPVEPEVED